MDTTQTTTHISLCAGYGGIDLGLKRAIPNLRTIAFSEIEAFACANLVAKMEAGWLDAAPIWTDLKSFPWGAFRDRVDVLSGGYPCQPFSAAGKRLGAEDERHLWPFIATGIAAMRPRLCFFENVEGHISLGLREVISDLESLGYKTTWGIFSAAEVGAPHQRKRAFILAYHLSQRIEELGRQIAAASQFDSASDHGGSAWPSRPGEPQHGWEPPRVVVDSKSKRTGQRPELCSKECRSRSALPRDVEQSGEDMVDSTSARQQAQRDESNSQWRADAVSQSGELVNAESQRPTTRWPEHEGLCGESGIASAGGAMGNADSPRPQERQRQRGSELQGTHANGGEGAGWQTQSALGRDVDGPADWLDYAELCRTCDNRTDELRLLGNGVVPATAHHAFLTLRKELKTHCPTIL